jgi:ubiquinol-cytochrome c reductase iron-sulfur subunit
MQETPQPTAPDPASDAENSHNEGRRDFLMLACGCTAAAGVAGAAWPLLNSLRPAADVLALSTVEVDISRIPVGGAMTVMWRGKPVFIRHRTPAEIAEAEDVNIAALPDPEADKDRVKKPEWLVVVGICTHLGCVPNGQKDGDAKGDYDGWYCPCHGSHYDSSGRVRKGPAPENLHVPEYAFINDTTLRIG